MNLIGTRLAGAALLLALGCQPAGRLQYVQLDSQAEGRTLPYGVYEPPGWDRRTPLPIVLLLHGAGDDATTADRAAVTNELDAAITAGLMPPVLVVTPEGELGFWADWYDGSHHWAQWVLEEVVPDVRKRYPTVPGPAGLHLAGVSMGGGGGMQLWLHHREALGSATILSAPILSEADTRKFLSRYLPRSIFERAFGPPGSGQGTDPFVALAEPERLRGSRLFVGAAAHDKRLILESNEAFHEYLAQRQVPHRFVVFSGGHGWRAWGQVLPFALCHQLQAACGMTAPLAWTSTSTPAG